MPLLSCLDTHWPGCVAGASAVRAYARSAIDRLPPACRVARRVTVPVSEALHAMIKHLVESNNEHIGIEITHQVDSIELGKGPLGSSSSMLV